MDLLSLLIGFIAGLLVGGTIGAMALVGSIVAVGRVTQVALAQTPAQDLPDPEKTALSGSEDAYQAARDARNAATGPLGYPPPLPPQPAPPDAIAPILVPRGCRFCGATRAFLRKFGKRGGLGRD